MVKFSLIILLITLVFVAICGHKEINTTDEVDSNQRRLSPRRNHNRREIAKSRSQPGRSRKVQLQSKFQLGSDELNLLAVAEPAETKQTKIDYVSTSEKKSMCIAKFDEKRRYFIENEERNPPVLYSFPGAGNTWCRLLIEYATGIYTGSIYNDASLAEILPGEFACNRRVSMIKIHPHTNGYKSGLTPFGIGKYFKTDNNKCAKGAIREFKRAVFLIRDPYDAIWSEYQRRFAKSHVGLIYRTNFDQTSWRANAASLAHFFAQMWGHHYKDMIRDYGRHNILFLKYEDLKNPHTRIQELGKLAKFLYIQTSTERLECAFELATKSDAHRSSDPALYMTKKEAYTEDLVCEMWQLFGPFIVDFGYKPRDLYDCSMYFPIQNLELGSEGQLLTKPNLQIGVRRRSQPRHIGATSTTASISSDKNGEVKETIGNLHQEEIKAVGSSGTISTKVSFRAAAGKEGQKTDEGLIGLGFLGRSGPIWKDE